MINWADVQVETERALTSVRQQLAFYQQRIAELNAESSKLSAALEVAKDMQESGYMQRLMSPQTVETGTQLTQAQLEKLPDGPVELRFDFAKTETSKPNWQKGVEAVTDMPDLPPAQGLKRQPNKTNTSYRAAALLKEAGMQMHIDDIINEFKHRNWVDPTWTRPKEAITIAVKRSVTYGWTKQTGRYSYVFSPADPDHGREASEAPSKEEGV